MKIWDPITEDRIKTLHPAIREAAVKFILDAQAAGIFLRVTEGFRSWERQDEVYKKGLSKAKAGQSYHNYGMALDVVEIRDGRAIWNGRTIRTNCSKTIQMQLKKTYLVRLN